MDDIRHAETDYDIIRLVNKNRKRDQYYKLFGVLTIYQFGVNVYVLGDDDNGDGALLCSILFYVVDAFGENNKNFTINGLES